MVGRWGVPLGYCTGGGLGDASGVSTWSLLGVCLGIVLGYAWGRMVHCRWIHCWMVVTAWWVHGDSFGGCMVAR